MTGAGFVRAVVMANVAILALLLPLCGYLGGGSLAAGAAAGGLVGLGNFVAIAWLLRRLMGGPASRSKAVYGLLLGGKFLVLVMAIYLMARVFGLDAVGVAVGYSAMVLALLVGGFRYAVSQGDGNGNEGT